MMTEAGAASPTTDKSTSIGGLGGASEGDSFASWKLMGIWGDNNEFIFNTPLAHITNVQWAAVKLACRLDMQMALHVVHTHIHHTRSSEHSTIELDHWTGPLNWTISPLNMIGPLNLN